MSKEKSVSHRVGVRTVVERLCDQHGQVRAHKLALLEQQKARRARCRKRFHFWETVAGQFFGCEKTLHVCSASVLDG